MRKSLTKILRESLPEAIGALVAAAILFIVGSLVTSIVVGAIAVAILLWLGCIYVVLKRDTPRVLRANASHKAKGPWQYPRLKKWALVGVFLFPILAASTIIYHHYLTTRPARDFIILVANLDGPEPDKYRVTEVVLAQLRSELRPYSDIQVEALGRAVSEIEGSSIARQEGNDRKASLVVWGWYGVTNEAVLLNLHIEALDPLRFSTPSLCKSAQLQVKNPSLFTLDSFDFQAQLSGEVSYLTLGIAGIARYSVADYGKAIDFFNSALEYEAEWIGNIEPLAQSTLYFLRGNSYYFQDYFSQSLLDFNQAIDLREDYGEAMIMRAFALRESGDMLAAIGSLNQVVAIDPDNYTSYLTRGIFHYNNGNLAAALNDYNQALALQPSSGITYMARAYVHTAEDNHELAIRDYSQAHALEFITPCGYNNRGIAYYNTMAYDRALDDFDMALELAPSFHYPYIGRGMVYNKLGQHAKAIDEVTKAIELNPSDPSPYSWRASFYSSIDEEQKAEEDRRMYSELKKGAGAQEFGETIHLELEGGS
jgi:tetratricopeptide (TPR) repeat protein